MTGSARETRPNFSTRQCSRCSTTHNRSGRYCPKCHAAYMREWRASRKVVKRSNRVVLTAAASQHFADLARRFGEPETANTTPDRALNDDMAKEFR